MSNWIKITDDLFGLEASPDPQVVVSISELQGEIDILESKVKKTPDAETLDFYLEHHPEQIRLKEELDKKELLLKDILGE